MAVPLRCGSSTKKNTHNNQMQSQVVITLSIPELQSLIKDAVSEAVKLELQAHNKEPPNHGSEYLTRSQVAKILQISKPTAIDYTKRGILVGFRIGNTNSVRYLKSDVEAALQKIKTIKHSRVNDF